MFILILYYIILYYIIFIFTEIFTQDNKLVNEGNIIKKLINISIDSLGISFIVQSRGKIIESNYLYLKSLELGYMESTSIEQF